MRKKNKKKLSKGSLLLIGFLFICLSFFDLKAINNNTDSLLDNSIYTNVNANELINVIKSQSGLILIVNDNSQIDRLANSLLSFEPNEKIFVYNANSDEVIFDNNACKVVRRPSSGYRKLVNFLGSYTDNFNCGDGTISDTKYIHSPMVLFAKDGGVLYSYYLPEEEISDEILSYVFEKGFNMVNSYSVN